MSQEHYLVVLIVSTSLSVAIVAIAWFVYRGLPRLVRPKPPQPLAARRSQEPPRRNLAAESSLPLLYEPAQDGDDWEITVMGELEPEFVERMDGAESSAAIVSPGEAEPLPDIDIEIDEDAQPLILVTGRARTDRGLKRNANEDAYLVLDEIPLFLVADGMGGYAGGEVASKLAVEVIERAFRRRTFEGAMDLSKPPESDELVRSVHMAHKAVHEQAQEMPKYRDMGTTVVAARFATKNRVVYIAHVGDSRCYRVRGRTLTQLTRDHTMGALFGIDGKAGRRLAQALGVRDEVIVDLNVDFPLPGDTYLICSDGLTKMVDDDAILSYALEEESLDATAKRMVDEANRRGGKDNITVIVIRIDEPT